MRHAIIAVLLLAALCGPAVAGPFEDAVSALERGDYATALREFRVLAEQGLADAQYNLGVMYAKGEGVPHDYAEAGKWFRMAAEQADADAQYILGVMYYNGQGVPQDYAEAVKWFRMAAEQGHAGAQNNLGFILPPGALRSDPRERVQQPARPAGPHRRRRLPTAARHNGTGRRGAAR